MNFKQYQYLRRNVLKKDTSGQLLERYDKVEAEKISPLVLALLGDACFHQYIRLRLLSFEQNHVRLLNDLSAKFVSAVGQSSAYHAIKDDFTEEEADVFRRGFHAKSHAPRAASVKQYHESTGFEALLGYLYLKGCHERLEELSERAFLSIASSLAEKN